MLNILKIIFVSCLLVCSSNLSATIITTELSDDAYITYNGLDWAWAAPVSIQFNNCDDIVLNQENYLTTLYTESSPTCENQLLAAAFHPGWGFFDGTRQELLLAMPDLSLFDDNNGGYKNAFEYWNTTYSFANFGGINAYNITVGRVVSDWTTDAWRANNDNNFYYNVLYVRGTQPQPVPEPSTLLIFALGLIALASRKKTFN